MKKSVLAWLAVLAVTASMVHGQQILSPGDPILAVDLDVSVNSSYPGGEAPRFSLDNDGSSKYLNFGEEGTGLIFSPVAGSTTVQSMMFRTAGDAPERDPGSWELYGTNDVIMSGDNSDGFGENWTLISSGMADLPDGRVVDGPVYSFGNTDGYASYKVLFPTVKDAGNANSMQVADILLYESADGSGSSVASVDDPVVAVGALKSESNYPGAEGPGFGIDRNPGTKYLNFGKENTGFIVTPQGPDAGAPIKSIKFTTANDEPNRDPASWVLWGTDDPISSLDNSDGSGESWTEIAAGEFTMDQMPTDRSTQGVAVRLAGNDSVFSSYRMTFPTLRDGGGANSMQFADVSFAAVVPEPSALGLAGLALMALACVRRR